MAYKTYDASGRLARVTVTGDEPAPAGLDVQLANPSVQNLIIWVVKLGPALLGSTLLWTYIKDQYHWHPAYRLIAAVSPVVLVAVSISISRIFRGIYFSLFGGAASVVVFTYSSHRWDEVWGAFAGAGTLLITVVYVWQSVRE